jgi:hypothetical protein
MIARNGQMLITFQRQPMRRCPLCKKNLPWTNFFFAKRRTGLRFICKTCDARASKIYRRKLPQGVQEELMTELEKEAKSERLKIYERQWEQNKRIEYVPLPDDPDDD